MDYLKLTKFYESLEKTTKRLEKTKIISELLKSCTLNELEFVPLLIEGKIFPLWDKRKIGVSTQLVKKALEKVTGNSLKEIEKLFIKLGDLGEVAFELIKNKKQTTLGIKNISAEKVFENLRKLASIEGESAVNKKVFLISELLSNASASEAKFIVKTILDEMRVGVGEGTLRDAIVWAFWKGKVGYDEKTNEIILEDREKYNQAIEIVQKEYNVVNDFSEVAVKIKKEGFHLLKESKLHGARPIKVMLYQKAKDIEDAFSIVGKPCIFEYKYDGFRVIICKDKKGEIKLYTRRLENVTKQFPEIVELTKKNVKAEDFILDSEVIGIDPKTKKWLPFQHISQRIKRKYDIEKISKEIPVITNIFDVMYANGDNLLNKPLKVRRKIIEKIVKPVQMKLQLAKQIVTDDIKTVEKFYAESLKLGNEGIMAKNLEGIYKPGSRVGYGVKIKPVLETLDLVIVKAEWGEGKRKKWLSSFTVACYDENKKEFLEIGKVGTGVKEKEGLTFKKLTKILKPSIIKEEGKTVFVKPKLVIEVDYEEIQKSPTYSSGFALRFPRVVKMREDKSVKDINDIESIKYIYLKQRNR